MKSLLAIGLALLTGPREKWTIDFTLSLSEKEGTWVFSVDGTTDLPPETVLRARVFAVTMVDHPFDGPREDDDEALVRADDPIRPSFVEFKAGKGRFSEKVYGFRRKPYSIRYRAKVFYRPEDQTDAVTLKVGDAEFFRTADLRVGTDASYEAELKERSAEAGKDFMNLEKLGGALAGWVAAAPADPDGWGAWKRMALAETAAVQMRNEHRFDLWAVYLESQSRFRLRGLCDAVERIIAFIDDRDGVGVLPWLRWYEQSVDAAYTTLGIDAPLDEGRAKPAFAAYEATMASLRGNIDRPDVRRRARAEGVAALFDLLQMIRTRQRAYIHVNTLGARFTRIFQLADADAPGEEVKAALEAHDAALREFRRFAGLP